MGGGAVVGRIRHHRPPWTNGTFLMRLSAPPRRRRCSAWSRQVFSETGIKESDWLGKFWVRWSDAVREAGFSPNAMQSAYSDEWLLEKYAMLVRDLGRCPTHPDLRLKSRNDCEFPSHSTFSRFGSKTELLARLIAHCRSRDAYSDIVAICEPLLPSIEPPQRTPLQRAEEGMGFVYLIKAGRHYKIGKTQCCWSPGARACHPASGEGGNRSCHPN